METMEQTTLATWRKNPDGSWEPLRVDRVRNPNTPNPGGGSGFLTEFEVVGGDNIIIEHVGDGSIVLRQGGHVIADHNVPTPFEPQLNFIGTGVSVSDDPANARTNIEIDAGSGSGGMIWRGPYDMGSSYSPGDVVVFGDGLFVYDGPITFGYGYGPYGGGPYGAGSGGGGGGEGFGGDPYGSGPYGG